LLSGPIGHNLPIELNDRAITDVFLNENIKQHLTKTDLRKVLSILKDIPPSSLYSLIVD
jgi:hypothetical protein